MFNIAYIDGDHSCLSCFEDLIIVDQITSKNAIIALDDYYKNPESHFGIVKAVNMFLGHHSEKYEVYSRNEGQIILLKE